ncbi:MAG TPA: ester cyclase, partial [Polyangiaceae bacterium]|nr:ester cyclase [Polyangiaceae bacterium]
DVKLTVDKSWAAGDYLVSEGTFSGTNDGDIPSMKVKKTGKKVSARFLEVDKIQGGKFKNQWIFDNGMAFAMQLGLVPPPGAKPDAKGAKPDAKAAKPDAKAAPAATKAEAKPEAKPAAAKPEAKPAAAPAKPKTP